jgi:hyperosmotically inducible protein
MFRALLRIVVVIVIVAAIAAFFVGYRFGDGDRAIETDPVVGTSGPDLDPDIDVGRARETGARVGERIAAGANRVERIATDAALTAKIKSKMVLDDNVEAADIDIDAAGSVVTLRGTVSSQDERQRAVRMARETEGVTSVVDQLVVQ